MGDEELQSTPRRRLSIGRPNAQAGPELLEGRRREPLGEHVGELLRSREPVGEHTELTKSDLFANEMGVELDVFGPSMLYWIVSKINDTNIVTEHSGGTGDRSMKLL